MIDKYRLDDLRLESGEKGELARWVIQLQKDLDYERRKVSAPPTLAAMDAEPVADVVAWSHPNHPDTTCSVRLRRFDLAPGPLFAVAQPVAVVPGELDYQGAKELFNYLMTEEETIATVNGWNAFRAAMIQANNIN